MSPEQLSPAINEHRLSASAIYTVPIGAEGFWSTSAVWAERCAFGLAGHGPTLDAWVLESTIHLDTHWTLYARAERIDNDELLAVPVGQLGQAFTVGKVGLGAIRDFAVAPHLKLGLGAQAARNFTGGLSNPYGGDRWGEMGFVRLKLG